MSGGGLGYLLFGDGVCGNVLNAFSPNDIAMSVASVALSLVNLFKLPLLILPMRDAINSSVGLPERPGKLIAAGETAVLMGKL